MKSEDVRLCLEAELLALRCNLEGMLAENSARTRQDQALAYGEDAFTGLANIVLDRLRQFIQGVG